MSARMLSTRRVIRPSRACTCATSRCSSNSVPCMRCTMDFELKMRGRKPTHVLPSPMYLRTSSDFVRRAPPTTSRYMRTASISKCLRSSGNKHSLAPTYAADPLLGVLLSSSGAGPKLGFSSAVVRLNCFISTAGVISKICNKVFARTVSWRRGRTPRT